ncbi:hypothetical protein J1N35_001890 [Gossypium stocksii]|uniref:RNase H type-1 domain-containing protein n=1 Tax=Gossypium stocksii TaxID=47602 RepID=A0A9D3WIL5_9ROSI|nr:hypothetical protein J1N35_001890 [Gossypium stocksii]
MFLLVVTLVFKILWLQVLLGQGVIYQSLRRIQQFAMALACWSPSNHGWIKMNSDGAVSMNNDNASIGGLFRDLDSHWLCGYFLKVSKEMVFRIKARAILRGLCIALEKGYRQLEIECDNAVLVESVLVLPVVT